MTLLLFSFRHTSLLTVHTDMHGHTASGCLCRNRPLQWCLMYKLGFQLTVRTQPLYVVLIYLS